MNKRILYSAIVVFVFVPIFSIKAQSNNGVIVSPVIIDEKVEAKDLKEYVVKVYNGGEKRVSLYPIVSDVLKDGGKQERLDPTKLDKGTSVTRWIDFSRGVINLMPGEEKEIPLKINVNLSAKPGKYYATIVFSDGGNFPIAEERAKEFNQPELMINIEVEENILEKLQIIQFKNEKSFNFSSPINFILGLENTGNRDLEPSGTISIYNRRGEEVDTIDINSEKFKIASEENKDIMVDWSTPKVLGKYKAKINIEYGEDTPKDLQDTIYFWYLPRGILFIFSGLFFALIISLAVLIFRKTNSDENRDGKIRKSEIINLR